MTTVGAGPYADVHLVRTGPAEHGRTLVVAQVRDELAGLANHVGLLAEEYDDVAQRMTGNFPQAFSHLALVEAATVLARGSGEGAGGTGSATAQRQTTQGSSE